jgi:hypothetical protein
MRQVSIELFTDLACRFAERHKGSRNNSPRATSVSVEEQDVDRAAVEQWGT